MGYEELRKYLREKVDALLRMALYFSAFLIINAWIYGMEQFARIVVSIKKAIDAIRKFPLIRMVERTLRTLMDYSDYDPEKRQLRDGEQAAAPIASPSEMSKKDIELEKDPQDRAKGVGGADEAGKSSSVG